MNFRNKLSISYNPLKIFLCGATLLALILGALGLYIYRASGSYALDLSRPGYSSAQSDINYTSENDRLRVKSDGVINLDFIKEVDRALDYYLRQTVDEPFADRAMSDETLGIIAPAEQAPTVKLETKE
ncbi:MAG: hypothetical protein Q3996_00155 [Candidatus Saccharibacteria bacterium]|nr:hypothetical protein [Candidatus Saccharibacteria bacterium]